MKAAAYDENGTSVGIVRRIRDVPRVCAQVNLFDDREIVKRLYNSFRCSVRQLSISNDNPHAASIQERDVFAANPVCDAGNARRVVVPNRRGFSLCASRNFLSTVAFPV
jgi:hypothetical protein